MSNPLSSLSSLTIHPDPTFDKRRATAELKRHVATLETVIERPHALMPATEASFAILAASAAYTATTRQSKLLDQLEQNFELLSTSPDEGAPFETIACDFVRAVMPIIQHVLNAIDLDSTSVPPASIALVLWQSTLQFLERDPDLNPFTLAEQSCELFSAVRDGRSADCLGSVQAIMNEVMTSTSLTAPPFSPPNTNLRCGLDPFDRELERVPIEPKTPVVIWQNVPLPASREIAALARLRVRLASLDAMVSPNAVERTRIEKRIRYAEKWIDFCDEQNAKLTGEPKIVKAIGIAH